MESEFQIWKTVTQEVWSNVRALLLHVRDELSVQAHPVLHPEGALSNGNATNSAPAPKHQCISQRAGLASHGELCSPLTASSVSQGVFVSLPPLSVTPGRRWSCKATPKPAQCQTSPYHSQRENSYQVLLAHVDLGDSQIRSCVSRIFHLPGDELGLRQVSQVFNFKINLHDFRGRTLGTAAKRGKEMVVHMTDKPGI